MSAEMCSLSHWWVLNLNTDQTKTERNDPSCVVDRLKILTVSFSISNNATSSFCWDSEANEVKYEIRDAHIDCVPIEHELTIMRSCSWSLNESVPHICNTDPNTANKIQKQIDPLSGRCNFFVQLLVQDQFTIRIRFSFFENGVLQGPCSIEQCNGLP